VTITIWGIAAAHNLPSIVNSGGTAGGSSQRPQVDNPATPPEKASELSRGILAIAHDGIKDYRKESRSRVTG
jgi:hypothetical protein